MTMPPQPSSGPAFLMPEEPGVAQPGRIEPRAGQGKDEVLGASESPWIFKFSFCYLQCRLSR
jgi:hypothetical protein